MATENGRRVVPPASREKLIAEWLARQGLHFNPFATTNSETDRYLEQYYVAHRTYLENRSADSALIYANTGAGKSATRLSLEAWFLDTFATNRTFVFSYVLTEESPADLDMALDSFLPQILSSAVASVFLFFAQYGYALPELVADAETAPCLAGFFDRYYPVGDWRADLLTSIEQRSLLVPMQHLAYRPFEPEVPPAAPDTVSARWLRDWHDLLTCEPAVSARMRALPPGFPAWHALRDLLTRSGVRRILLLVDGIDARSGLAPDAATRMAALAIPLARAATEKLFGDNVGVKLFLPRSIWGQLIAQPAVNIPSYFVEWGHSELAQLLHARLAAASDGLIDHMNQLAEVDVPDLEGYLIAEASASPRQLISLTNHLIETLVQDFTNRQFPGRITRDIVQAFAAQRQ